MTSYFEQLFKQMFIQRYSHINNVEGNIKGRPIKIASEYKKILDKVAIGMIYDSFENEKIIDAMLQLTRSERIILAFNIIAEMRMAEIGRSMLVLYCLRRSQPLAPCVSRVVTYDIGVESIVASSTEHNAEMINDNNM